MAIPPRRWVGYALLIAGLSLLFDTYTFLRTAWSPLHIPMYAPNELALGYVLAVLGLLLLFAPTLVGMLDSYAPDGSMKMGVGLASESVASRRQVRLPLRGRFSTLPNRGLVGGALALLLLVPAFVMVTEQDLAWGVYVRLAPRHRAGLDQVCLEGPIVVTVKQHESFVEMFVNGTEVSREGLQRVLKSKLARRADWEVFVEGDESVAFSDTMDAIDAIRPFMRRP